MTVALPCSAATWRGVVPSWGRKGGVAVGVGSDANSRETRRLSRAQHDSQENFHQAHSAECFLVGPGVQQGGCARKMSPLGREMQWCRAVLLRIQKTKSGW